MIRIKEWIIIIKADKRMDDMDKGIDDKDKRMDDNHKS